MSNEETRDGDKAPSAAPDCERLVKHIFVLFKYLPTTIAHWWSSAEPKPISKSKDPTIVVPPVWSTCWLAAPVLLGFVFGTVIGLFAGYLSLPTDSAVNGLGLSALALLAGYNVPAMSAFLDDLSIRLFRLQERNALAA